LHRHNWLSFGKFQDTERFLIHCARHFSSRLPPRGGTCKYAKAPSTKKNFDSLPIDMLLSAVSVLVVAQSRSEPLEGLMNNPVELLFCFTAWWIYSHNGRQPCILQSCSSIEGTTETQASTISNITYQPRSPEHWRLSVWRLWIV